MGEDLSAALAKTQPHGGGPQQRDEETAGAPSLVGRSVGPYRVVRQLGRGGMGVVYEAVHERIGQRAAVKTLHARFSADPQFTQRFLNEARAAIIAQHAGLVKVFDCGQLSDGTLYILMEFLEGEPLSSRLTKTPGPSELEAARLTRQIAAAMSVAHDKGIVHRGR